LPPGKQAVLAAWKRGEARPVKAVSAIPARVPGTPVPLSIRQEWGLRQRVWLRGELIDAANIFFIAWLDGPVKEEALARSVTQLVCRHESLRMTVRPADGRIHLAISDEPQGGMDVIPAGSLSDEAVMTQATQFVLEPFDLVAGPLARMALYRLAPSRRLLAIAAHHLIADGASLGIALGELVELYNAATEDRPPALTPATQYGDFAIWQRQQGGDQLHQDVQYWRPRLTGIRRLHLQNGNPPQSRKHGSGSNDIGLRRDEFARVREWIRRADVTLFMALVAATVLAVSKVFGERDITVGCEAENRTLPETRSMIGFVFNVVVLRVTLEETMTLREVLDHVRAVCLGMYAHSATPIEQVLNEIFPGRDPSTIPLFQVHFTLQPRLPRLSLGDVRIEPVDIAAVGTWYDLEFQLWQGTDDLSGLVSFDREAVSDDDARQVAAQVRAFIEVMMEHPDRRICEYGCARPADVAGAAEDLSGAATDT
jgi:Condensation domain